MNVMNTMLDPLVNLMVQVWSKVPSVLGALVILLLGSFLGRWLRYGAEKLLKMSNLDTATSKAGINGVLVKLGVGDSPTAIIGFLVYWLVFLAFLLSAANVVQLTVVSEFLQQLVLFVPKLIAAVLVLGAGLFLGHFAGDIVLKAAQANGIHGAEGLSRAAYLTLVIFSAIIALQRVGIDTSILAHSVEIVLGSIGLAFAIAAGIAFGSAGKEAAARRLQEWENRKK